MTVGMGIDLVQGHNKGYILLHDVRFPSNFGVCVTFLICLHGGDETTELYGCSSVGLSTSIGM